MGITKPPSTEPASIAEVMHLALASIVREQLRSRAASTAAAPAAAAASRWMTPPAAARATGVPLKAIRAYIRTHRIEARLRNSAANPRQRKYLVNVDEVVRVATLSMRPDPPPDKMSAESVGADRQDPDGWVRSRLTNE